ncbi:FecCD family ABC transporter permease [Roseibium sp.]|uniref:FecCD family ABC transporter permease n=1 Tax=Roseibium sp. TaxID=1936156 RepID=UPI003B502F3A
MKHWVWLSLLLLAALGLSLFTGVRSISAEQALQALFALDSTNPNHIAFVYVRAPRVVAGLVCGAALATAGMAIQATTRNPLADPGILGVNAGAAFAIAIGTLLAGRADGTLLAFLAFPGAAIAAIMVFALGGGLHGSASPVRLTLAGSALSALLFSLVTAIVLLRGEALEVVRFWVVGSLSEARTRPLLTMSAVAIAGGALLLTIATKLETLALGETLARGLGTRPRQVQAIVLLAVTLLTGAAVALAGPIAFLGLMIPPIARRIAGASLRPGILAAAMLGASVLLLADVAGRVLFAPAEIQAGIMTALIGGPVFVLIARRLSPGAVA